MQITDELFNQYEKLVYFCYHKLDKTTFVVNNREDLLQEGFLALLKAIETYEEYRTVCLSSYIFHSIKYAMYHYIRDNTREYSFNIEEFIEAEELVYEDTEDVSAEECVKTLLNDYRYYLENYKNKNAKVDIRVARASIILEEYTKYGKVSTRRIEEEFYINRSTVSEIIKELRKTILMKQENKLYKGKKSND